MQIQVDSREHASEWERISKQLDKLGVKYFRSKLYVGDYQSLDNARLVIDRKKNLQELCGNVCQQHERFQKELKRAQEAGIQIIFLVEHGSGIRDLADVYFWENPRLKYTDIRIVDGRPRRVQKSPNAITGKTLFKTLETISRRYGVRFEFCTKAETGKRIVELLGGEANGKQN